MKCSHYFRECVASKCPKVRYKNYCLCDTKTSYLLNTYIHTKKGSDSTGLNEMQKPTRLVVMLCKPIVNSNRYVTTKNWFSSIKVVDELIKRNLTYVGTLKKGKKAIPEQFLQDPQCSMGSFLYSFRDKMTLISFVSKKNWVLVLISSIHHSI